MDIKIGIPLALERGLKISRFEYIIDWLAVRGGRFQKIDIKKDYLNDPMATIKEQIELLEEEIKNTKYNKATQHHIGKLKAKVARLREDLEKNRSTGRSSGGYEVKKSGNATVSLVGFPSVGKSTLLNAITDANSEVGTYNFTTLEVVPGTLHYRGAKIQILDLPGLIEGASKGKGRGRQVISAARSSDLIILMLDVFSPDLSILMNELWVSKIRLNESPPVITITVSDSGGIEVATTCEQPYITRELIKDMVRTYGYVNATVVVRTPIRPYQLIDSLTGGVKYLPTILLINKVDLAIPNIVAGLKERYMTYHPLAISVHEKQGVEAIKVRLFKTLRFIRIYLKPQGSKADLDEPMVVKSGTDVEAICNNIHRDFVEQFRYAYVWGPSSKFPGQKVGLNHVLSDGDILSIIIRR